LTKEETRTHKLVAPEVASHIAFSRMQAPVHTSKKGVISLFHDEQSCLCVPLEASSHNADLPVCSSIAVEPSRTAATSCAACVAVFLDFIDQRAHFKSDWHRYAHSAVFGTQINSAWLRALSYLALFLQYFLIFP